MQHLLACTFFFACLHLHTTYFLSCINNIYLRYELIAIVILKNLVKKGLIPVTCMRYYSIQNSNLGFCVIFILSQ